MSYVPPHDRVAENSTSSSQSIFAVTGALDTSYRAFAAFMSVGDVTIGGVVEEGVAFKSGILKYSNTNEVTVLTALESAGAFSPSGVKEVFMGLPASLSGATPPTLSKSANYTVVAADKDALILLSSAATLSFTAAATLGDKFKFRVRNTNSATGLWTLDPNSSETINGKTTLTLGLGEEMDIFCDGTAFYTSASRGRMVELGRVTASASAVVDFDFAAGFPTDFDEFEVHCVNILAATNDTYLCCRIKTTAALTVQSASYLYAARIQGVGGGADGGSTVDGLTTHLPLARPVATAGMGNGSTFVLNGVMKVSSPNSIARQTIEGRSGYFRQTAVDYVNWTYTGAWVGTGDPITGLSFFMSSGNIASGTFVLYGRRK